MSNVKQNGETKSPVKNNTNNQYPQPGQVDMKGDLQQLVNGIGQEAQIKMQQQLAQLVVNRVYKIEDDKKKKEEEENRKTEEGESCGTMCFKRCCFFLDLEFYMPYFKQVTTSAVMKRIGYSLFPFKAGFFSVADNSPDMYGPLWLSFSLVFALTAAGNLSMYLQSPDPSHFSYKFSFVELAFSLVFGYVIMVPIFVAFLMKLFGSHSAFYIQTMCIYGYSLFVFIPVTLLCTLPYTIVQYSLFFYAAINSTFFLLHNFSSKLNELKTEEGQTDRKKILIGIIAGIQILLMLMYKLYFFKQVYTQTGELAGNEDEVDLYPFNKINSFYNSTIYQNHNHTDPFPKVHKKLFHHQDD